MDTPPGGFGGMGDYSLTWTLTVTRIRTLNPLEARIMLRKTEASPCS